MATNLNLNSLVVDSSGRASFSGLSTGIDLKSTVDQLIAAKRIPIDSIKQRISQNEVKIAAFNDLQDLAFNLRTASDRLRGALSFDGAKDVFEAKQAFMTTSRQDSATASDAGALAGVAVTSRAQAASHSVEILQVATAHKIASDKITGDLDDALGQVGSFTLQGKTVTLDGSESLFDLRDSINALNSGTDATGVSASIVSISSTEHYLMLSADETGTDAAITLADSSGTALQGLGLLDGTGSIKNELKAAGNARLLVDGLTSDEVERQSNTIDDVFEGVTLSLFKAESGTTIKLDIERNLNDAKSAIVDFVDAYNELRSFINNQARTDVAEGDTSGAGVLANTGGLAEIRSRLSGAIGSRVAAEDPALAVLAQIGITFQSASAVSDPTQANTLVIDQSKLDNALLTQASDIRSLFGFQMSSSSSQARLVGFDGQTGYQAGGYQLNVAYANGAIVSANLGGAADGSDDGSVSVSGNVLTVENGNAKGLKLLYSGQASASGIQVDISVGVAANVFNTVDKLLDTTDGLITNESKSLTDQSSFQQGRVDRMTERLERERTRLTERFANMEAALSQMNRLLESIRQQVDAAFGGSSS